MNRKLTRREFLKISALGGTGLVIGFTLPGCDKVSLPEPTATPESSPTPELLQVHPELDRYITTTPELPQVPFVPNAYVTITPDDQVTLVVARSEMGQGVQTALPMILAEELCADWSRVKMVQAPPDSKYGDQVTGGSLSVQTSFDALRLAGSKARDLLLAAAAQLWNLPKEELVAEKGKVLHTASGQQATFGELAPLAATLKSASIAPLKKAEEYTLIGTRQGQVENPNIVTGRARYGSDLHLPGMLYAVVARCPELGGKLKSFDASQAEAIPGVRKVVEIDSGVGVVAENTWAAIQGRRALQIEWNHGLNARLTSESIHQAFLDQAKARVAPTRDAAGVARTVEATYEFPYLAHTTMEPMTCTADLTADHFTVYAPTQDRQAAKLIARTASKLSGQDLELIVPLIGCGSGRRLRVDYVPEAVQLSQAAGAPVKVIWTRDDDVQHDYYRPASYHRLSAALDSQGLPVDWQHDIFSQGIDGTQAISQGASNLPYKLKKTVRAFGTSIDLPTGYWRSVYNNQNAFANEAFMDELAEAGGKDPLELRLALLGDGPLKGVLELAAEKAGWGSTPPAGMGRGIACHSTWGVTHVAQVVEVSLEANGAFRVHRVVCVVDCGLVINPDMVEAQMEGGIVFGISALRGGMTFDKGCAQQTNFHDFNLLRIDEMPVVEVYIQPSTRSPTGIGEMGNPPTGPAVVNAIYALTGKRIRSLPVRPEDLG